jgi:putative ABC transport system permease protein
MGKLPAMNSWVELPGPAINKQELPMGVLRFKVFREVWMYKSRTLQVVLIIGIGAAAIGMILGTRNLVIPGMQNMWRGIHPAMINLYIGPSISEDGLVSLKRESGVQEIEGFSTTTIEWRLSPNDEWKPGGLTMRPDYQNQVLNKLELVKGEWPTDKAIGIENGSDSFFGINLGAPVYLRINDREFYIRSTGVLYNQLSQPATFGGTAQFYVTIGDRDFNRLLVTAPVWNEKSVQDLADRLQNRLEKQGITSSRLITDPNKHFFQDQMDGLFLLLGVLSVLALVLGLLLVYNTINALISQQIDQIGILKAVGARTWQIMLNYFGMIFLYSLMAMLVALPLGIFGARGISSWLVGSFGATLGVFRIDRTSVLVMVIVVLVAPLLASLVPILSGARTTVRDAISTYGLNARAGLLERILARARHVSRMALLTISNAFRHKWRVALLQVSLVMSGLMFMMVISVQDAVAHTIRDVMFSILNTDATYVLNQSARIEEIDKLVLSYPGVKSVEMWGLIGATIRPKGQPESNDDKSALMLGVPLPTQLYGYQLRAGRWLEPQDERAVVLNQKLADDAGVGVGDWITVKYGENNSTDWRVVGLVFDPILTNSANVPRNILLRDNGIVGRSNTVWVKFNTEDPASQIAIAKGLRDYLKKNNVDVSAQRGVFGIGGDSTAETGNAFINQFNFLVVLLGLMAVIIGVVGSIALSGALSLSVMERRREIGVMRAIGASAWSIFRLFIGEGLILGWLSWLIALPLSIPAGQLMVKALGAAFQLDIVYQYTPRGAIMWLVIITILSIFASWLPAFGATRISVRESLAYQ